MKLLSYVKQLYHRLADYLDHQYILHQIRHVHGARPRPLTNQEFYVFCLVKNGEEHIDEFVRHYRALGAKQILLIDNQSEDHTVEKAKSYENVTVFSSSLHFALYECRMRRSFLKHYCKNSWVMAVDIDEHFDFPGRGHAGMPQLIAYLNTHGYTAVTACMLDMFTVNNQDQATTTDFSARYPCTDIADIEKAAYPTNWLTRNNAVPAGICIYKNGIRKVALQTDHEFLLSKHPLMFVDHAIIPFTHPHYCAHARIADITCVLLHYKFTRGFVARTLKIAMASDTHPHWAKENLLYAEYFSRYNLNNLAKKAYSYHSVDDLSENQFLYVSDRYYRHLHALPATTPS